MIGRFTQEDTYRGDGLNLYAYCAGNPVYYVDPNGMSEEELCPNQIKNILKKINKRKAKREDIKKISRHLKNKINNKIELTLPEKRAAGKLNIINYYEIPTVRNDKFNKWFDSISLSEYRRVWKIPYLREIIEDRIRHPYNLHEWLMVSRSNVFKKWGISMNDIKKFRTSISAIEFKNPYGIHGGEGSTTAHNEILHLIDTSSSYEDYVQKLNQWAKIRLKNGISDLPVGLRR